MAEIVWSKITTDNRDAIKKDPDCPGTINAAFKRSIFADNNKVGMTVSVLRTGNAGRPNSGDRWYKWITTQAFGFRMSSRGRPIPYHATRGGNLSSKDLWRNRPIDKTFQMVFNTKEESETIFSEYVTRVFGFSNLQEYFPMAKTWGIQSFQNIPHNMRVAMREDSIDSMGTILFGKNRFNSKWADAMFNSEPYFISIAEQMKTMSESDDLLTFIDNNEFDEEVEDLSIVNPRIKIYVSTLDPKSYPKLLHDVVDIDDIKRINYLCDIGMGPSMRHLMKRAAGKDIGTWTDLHDTILKA